MDQRETACFGHADDLGKIVPYRGFSAGKLHIARPGSLPEAIHLKGDTLKGRFRRNLFSGAGITDGATQIAPSRHFNQPRTGMLGMIRAQPAVERTTALPLHERMPGMRGRLVADPRPEIRHTAPYGNGKNTVLRALLTQKNGGDTLFRRIKHIFGGNAPQADGADALRGLRQGTGRGRHRGSVMSIPYSAHKSTSLSQHSASRSPHKVMSAPPPVFS